jgi:hypothetical protein
VWKNKHRRVFTVIIKDAGEIFTGYFRRPNMEELSATSKLTKVDEVKAANIMFDGCFLGGDEIIKEDATLRMAAISQLSVINKIDEVKTKNL